MENLFLGIDISKEKINICLMKELKIVHEDEVRVTTPTNLTSYSTP